jgi:hypothetical protein
MKKNIFTYFFLSSILYFNYSCSYNHKKSVQTKFKKEKNISQKVLFNHNKNELTQLKVGETFSQGFDNFEFIENFKFLGDIYLKNEMFKLYVFIKKIKVAIGYRGQCKIIFLGNNCVFSYNIEVDQIPTNLIKNKLFFHKEYIEINTIPKSLKIPHDVLILEEKKIESRVFTLLNIKS